MKPEKLSREWDIHIIFIKFSNEYGNISVIVNYLSSGRAIAAVDRGKHQGYS
jgi:hypothetical protein